MERYVDANGKEDLRGWPFVVPGGRFNELYGNFPAPISADRFSL